MRKYWLYLLLGAEVLLCAAAALFVLAADAGGLLSAQQFPLATIGSLLRALSLSGAGGNAVAIALYILICCIPAAVLAVGLWRRKAKPEDVLLGILTAYLFYAVYMMINPADIGLTLGQEDIGKTVLGGVFWSLLAGWLALRLMRFVKNRSSEKVLRMSGALFAVTAAIIVLFAVFAGLIDLKASIGTLEAGNTDMSFAINVSGAFESYDVLMPTKIFMVIKYFIDLIPAVMDILILLLAKKLTELMRTDRYAEGVVMASSKLASLCKNAVIVTVISAAGISLLQLLFAGSLRSTDFTVSIPLFSIILALCMLLLSRYLAESRTIKRENDMFV